MVGTGHKVVNKTHGPGLVGGYSQESGVFSQIGKKEHNILRGMDLTNNKNYECNLGQSTFEQEA